jgi:hypothetical protein
MPVSRNGVPDIFNPYALQDNDIILVILTIYQTGGSQITVTDDLLKYTSESGDRICRPIGGTFSINPADAGADPLVWVMEPTGESAIISYQCKVER